MSEIKNEAELIQKARECAEDLLVFVRKYRSDPENYLTTHEQLDIEESEAFLWNGLCDALETSLERESNWRKLYVDACDHYLGLGAGAEAEADKAYENVFGTEERPND